jgi:adenosine deaminase
VLPRLEGCAHDPLVDLHRHLEGSIRPELCIELTTRAGSVTPPAQWRPALVAAEREEGLLSYLAKIENATALVRTLDDWRRVTVEAAADPNRLPVRSRLPGEERPAGNWRVSCRGPDRPGQVGVI